MTFSSQRPDVRLAHALGFTPAARTRAPVVHERQAPVLPFMGATEPARAARHYCSSTRRTTSSKRRCRTTARRTAWRRTRNEPFSDWTQPMEPKASTFTTAAASSAPWTWQDFFEALPHDVPFLINEGYDGASTGVYQLPRGRRAVQGDAGRERLGLALQHQVRLPVLGYQRLSHEHQRVRILRPDGHGQADRHVWRDARRSVVAYADQQHQPPVGQSGPGTRNVETPPGCPAARVPTTRS